MKFYPSSLVDMDPSFFYSKIKFGKKIILFCTSVLQLLTIMEI